MLQYLSGCLECNLVESINISIKDASVIIQVTVIKSKDNRPSSLQTLEDHFIGYTL